ncbi:MAG: phosphopantetheine adenylyltransferase [Sulfurovum sp. AS07-7]|nr:MAG: phosphopantetheine adenylyltransferase [Sulfurovum sp. AS07-7]MBD3794510.1 pantetheine-phosphate adenylyltransferase [Campylobacterota bacterium]MBD3839122.1 pantetheine-phosphate adenylyltransferase [Campylobacterota bacterium]
MKETKEAIYSGTFDPITNGHMDIIKRACKIFDKVVIAVALNSAKKPMFDLEKRIQLVKMATKNYPKIEVIGFESLLVDLSDKLGIDTIIRGLRAVSDFEYELQMGYANASLKKEIETIYLMPSLQYAFISSSIVRSLLDFNGAISHLVPAEILEELKGR